MPCILGGTCLFLPFHISIIPRPFCTFPSKIVFCGEIAALHSSGYWEYPTSARVVGEKNPKGTSRSTFKRHERVGLTLTKIKRENHDPRTWTSQVQTVIKWQAAVRCLVFRSRGAWQYATQRI